MNNQQTLEFSQRETKQLEASCQQLKTINDKVDINLIMSLLEKENKLDEKDPAIQILKNIWLSDQMSQLNTEDFIQILQQQLVLYSSSQYRVLFKNQK